MGIIAYFAYKDGDLNKLIYGTDSYGLVCGQSTSFFNTTIDLGNQKNLYYLNPVETLNPTTLPFAKTVCVNSCPSSNICPLSFPCTNPSAFM